MGPEFPPGSIGALGAGCICHDPEEVHPQCPLHGIFASIILALEESERDMREVRRQRAKLRMMAAAPVALVLIMLPVVLSIAFPMWIAECMLWGMIIGGLAVEWAWRV